MRVNSFLLISFFVSPLQCFVPVPTKQTNVPLRRLGPLKLSMQEEGCWNPKLRKSMAAVSSAGVLETAYLTITKLVGGQVMCGTEECNSVLNGPYAYLPGTEIPLSALGLVAYIGVLFLTLQPIVTKTMEDGDNRILITASTTTMAVFSIFLMMLLFGVLHQSCLFCGLSALFSVILAKLAWFGGALPSERLKEGVQVSTLGALTAFLAVLVLFFNDEPTMGTYLKNPNVSVVLADASSQRKGQAPPPITTSSSPRALELAKGLQALDTKMYGAFWCSHCYEQKQRLGKEAFAKIQYVECDKDGMDAQRPLCKQNNVPGYPTWSINGKLYPGERSLDELEDIVKELRGQ